jgi:hypothetical protein
MRRISGSDRTPAKIDQRCIEEDKILGIASRDRQTVAQRGRSDLRVRDPCRTASAARLRHQAAVEQRILLLERRDAALERLHHGLAQPRLEAAAPTAWRHHLDPERQLGDGRAREIELVRRPALEPRHHFGIRTRPLRLADHVGVENDPRQGSEVSWLAAIVDAPAVGIGFGRKRLALAKQLEQFPAGQPRRQGRAQDLAVLSLDRAAVCPRSPPQTLDQLRLELAHQ